MPEASQMPITDPEMKRLLTEITAVARASNKWYWRLLALIIAIATVISATFQVLSYVCS